jgi:hypothetical protein
VSQYPALKGLLMRNASGEMSTNRLVGIFSPFSVTGSALFVAPALISPFASLARSAWLVCAERATEKNRNT